jgi:hypothetical protein
VALAAPAVLVALAAPAVLASLVVLVHPAGLAVSLSLGKELQRSADVLVVCCKNWKAAQRVAHGIA